MRLSPFAEYATVVAWERNPREGAEPLPAFLLDQGASYPTKPYLLFALGRRRKEREHGDDLGRSNVLSSLPIGERHG